MKLNKDICLKCCQEIKCKSYPCDEAYEMIFDDQWENGYFWCERQMQMIDLQVELNNIRGRCSEQAFFKKEKVFTNCPYLLEHILMEEAK